MGAHLGHRVPCHYGAHRGQYKTKPSNEHCVPHGFDRREMGRDVTTRGVEHESVSGGNEIKTVRYIPPWRIDPGDRQELIGPQGKKGPSQEPQKDRPDPLPNYAFFAGHRSPFNPIVMSKSLLPSLSPCLN